MSELGASRVYSWTGKLKLRKLVIFDNVEPSRTTITDGILTPPLLLDVFDIVES